jgi:hypothetical protein
LSSQIAHEKKVWLASTPTKKPAVSLSKHLLPRNFAHEKKIMACQHTDKKGL